MFIITGFEKVETFPDWVPVNVAMAPSKLPAKGVMVSDWVTLEVKYWISSKTIVDINPCIERVTEKLHVNCQIKFSNNI